MAVTISSVTASPLPGGYVHVSGLGTFDASYATSGEVIDLSAYILGTSSPIVVASASSGGYVPAHDLGTASAGKLLLFEAGADAAALDEVTATTDTSAVIVPFIAIGISA